MQRVTGFTFGFPGLFFVATLRGIRYKPVVAVSPPLPAKKDVARALLLRGSVFVHLDPRTAGVVVPARLRHQPQVVLQVGLDMPVPIPDLRVDDEGVFGTLSFKGQPFTCTVPWSAVFALVGDDAKGMVWPSEMPSEIAAEVERENKRKQSATADGWSAGGIGGSLGDDVSGPALETDDNGAELISLFEWRLTRPRKQRSSAPPRKKSDVPTIRPPYLRVVK